MGRSRPPTLMTLAHRCVRDGRLFSRGQLVLVACSGGPDSNALLHALGLLRKRIGHELAAVGVDHGLRQEAAAELDKARRVADELGVAFEMVRVDVAPGSNLQHRARIGRHAALQAAAERLGAERVATGHNADDRAETVMLRLLRGSGPRGLSALPAQAPALESGGVPLVRPLIDARRQDVMAHIERHRLPYALDPSNEDGRFLRVRVRRELMPLLEELSPGIVGHLCALAGMLEQQVGGAGTSPPSKLDNTLLAGLTRTQRLAIERARRLGKRQTTVRVSGGRDLHIGFFDDGPVVLGQE